MKKMLKDQKAMQDELFKLSVAVPKYPGLFKKWMIDIKDLQSSKGDTEIANGCKPFVNELDEMTNWYKVITSKLVVQAKKYREFGQSMLDSGFVDKPVNKRLCGLGDAFNETGVHVSEVAAPVAEAGEQMEDIWKSTNVPDKDKLVEVSMQMVHKAKQLVGDGKLQAKNGQNLIEMCKTIEGNGTPVKKKEVPKPVTEEPKPEKENLKPQKITRKPAAKPKPKPVIEKPKPVTEEPKPEKDFDGVYQDLDDINRMMVDIRNNLESIIKVC